MHAVHQVPNGFELRPPAEALSAVGLFIDRERRCCPFLRFALEVEPAAGPMWLRLTGPDGVVEFLRTELSLPASGETRQTPDQSADGQAVRRPGARRPG